MKSPIRTLIASIVTFAYFVALWYFCPKCMAVENASELGNLLAGVFSPVAFLWLIAGYLQQGEELRLNTKALNLQAEELNASVSQQGLLVAAAREQIELQKELIAREQDRAHRLAQPMFAFQGIDVYVPPNKDETRFYKLHVVNLGAIAINLHASISEETAWMHEAHVFQLLPNASWTPWIALSNNRLVDFDLTIFYTDSRNVQGTFRCRVENSQANGTPIARANVYATLMQSLLEPATGGPAPDQVSGVRPPDNGR